MAKRKQRRPPTGSRKSTRAGGSTAGRGAGRSRRGRKKGAARGSRPRKAKTAQKSSKASGKAVKPRRKPAARASAGRTSRRTSKRVVKRAASTRLAGGRTSPGKVLPKRPAGEHRLQIDRARRVLEEAVPGPPSSLDFDRHASAARTGRAEIEEARREHTESGPRFTGGDVDANWASAFSTGDEAPGGDMPTPDQDIVEEIGSSLGVQYADDEELKAVDKIEERDRHRWELDPASAEDYRDRAGKKGE